MKPIVFSTANDLKKQEGLSIGSSDWLVITQEIIDNFANASFDRQWIHVDQERAKAESPYGTTIAHGYLSLSLIPRLLEDIYVVKGLKQSINCAIKNIQFKNAIKVNSRIKLNASFAKVQIVGPLCKIEVKCSIIIEGEDIPALEGTVVFLYNF